MLPFWQNIIFFAANWKQEKISKSAKMATSKIPFLYLMNSNSNKRVETPEG